MVIGAIAGNLFSCSLAAYAFARLKFRLRTLWFAIMLVTIMLPIHVVVVPQYILFNKLGLGEHVRAADPAEVPGHRRVLRLLDGPVHPRHPPRAGRGGPASTAAATGGSSARVMLPLMGPAIATTAIFTFIWTWSDFFTPLIYLTDPIAYTVPVALRSFLDATAGSNWGAMFAMSVVTLIPLFLVFLFGQRFLVKGIATTGGK